VPCAPAVVRATTVFLVCAGGLAACAVVAPKAKVAPEAPSITSVVNSRFSVPVDLDHGGLLVSPAPARAVAAVSESEAHTMFYAADAVEGPHAFVIFGLGLVTVASRVEQPAPTTTTTTAPPPPSTVAPTTTTTSTPPPPTTTIPRPPPTTVAPTTTTTTVPPTSTATPASRTLPGAASVPTVAPGAALVGDLEAETPSTTTTVPAPSPSTAVPPTTAAGSGSPPSTALPTYHRHLAWVGIVWDATASCPGSTTTQASSPTATTYVAIIIDATTDHRVLTYRSGGSSPCTGATQTPAVSEPNELVSVAWQPVGPASTAVQIEVPPCGSYYGWTQVPTSGSVADQVVVSVPFDPTCGSAVPQSQSVDQVVPLGSGQGLVGHATVGPVQALQAPPGD
jgi:outer membrane biosynthesis protein TonB